MEPLLIHTRQLSKSPLPTVPPLIRAPHAVTYFPFGNTFTNGLNCS